MVGRDACVAPSMEQEYVVEQIQHFVVVAGDTADEDGPVLPGRISSIRPVLQTQ